MFYRCDTAIVSSLVEFCISHIHLLPMLLAIYECDRIQVHHTLIFLTQLIFLGIPFKALHDKNVFS